MRDEQVLVRETEIEDCEKLESKMSEKERGIIRRCWKVEPLKGLLEAKESSESCESIFDGEEIVGIFGCVRGENGVGYPWLMTSPEIEGIKLKFIRESKKYFIEMEKRYKILLCMVHKENEKLLKWLKWLGFEEKEEMGELIECVYRR